MVLRLIKTNSLLFSLLIVAPVSFGKVETAPCPSVTALQEAAPSMNAAIQQDDGFYTVFMNYQQSSFFDEYAGWHVGIRKISAESAHDAIVIGKYILQHTKIKINETSDANNDLYLCLYGPGDIHAIGFPLK